MARIAFCQRVVYPYFGVMSISAVLKKHGHQVELVMGSDTGRVKEELLRLNLDIVGFSVLMATGEHEWALEIAQGLKAGGFQGKTVFGGTQPTFFPKETMSSLQVDIVSIGEGELAFRELADCLDRKKDYSRVCGLWVRMPDGKVQENPKAPLIENLDTLPFPDRELYQKYGYFTHIDSIEVLAGRGCLFSCSYCLNTTAKDLYKGQGRFVRKHSVEYMIRQLEDLKERYQPKSFTFFDELFTVNKTWLREFCEEYPQRVGLPFVCNVTADTIDEESTRLLARAGVSRVCFGIESGNEHYRINTLNKRITNQQYVDTAQRLHRAGIKFLTSNMIGMPGETLEHAFETVALNQRIKTDFLYFSVFQPYPKLPMTKQLEENGMIKSFQSSDYETTFFKGSLIKQKNINELVNLHKFFYVAVKCPWLKPVIKKAIKLPPNWLFEQIFIMSFGWMQFTCFNRSPWQLLRMGLGNLKVYYNKKN